jgi:hypothetical protein
METVLTVLFFLANLFWFIHLYSKHQARKLIREEISNSLAEAERIYKEHIIIVTVEKHNDMFFLYDKHTNEFVCQGKDLIEINSIFGKRFPGKKALVAEGSELLFKEKVNE